MDPEFRHTLIFFKEGLPKKNLEKKIIFHQNPIEVWLFDGMAWPGKRFNSIQYLFTA
jgi:hypothetical protein